VLSETYVPVKKHKRRRSDRTGSTHRRIQKKWIKRHGTKWVPTVIQIPGQGMFVTPKTFEFLKTSTRAKP